MFVDFVNQLRAEGMEKMESIRKGAELRVRAIVLTALTTVLGLLPTAYGLGGLDQFVVPVAMALGWGLLFGSILTAFAFPPAVAVLDDFSNLWQRWTEKKSKPST